MEFFFFRNFCIPIRECIPLSWRGQGFSLLKGTPEIDFFIEVKGSLKWPLQLQIIHKFLPVFQKGTRSCSKCWIRWNSSLPLDFLRQQIYWEPRNLPLFQNPGKPGHSLLTDRSVTYPEASTKLLNQLERSTYGSEAWIWERLPGTP